MNKTIRPLMYVVACVVLVILVILVLSSNGIPFEYVIWRGK